MTSKSSYTYSYSTVKSVRDRIENVLNAPTITSVSYDFDKDGIVD